MNDIDTTEVSASEAPTVSDIPEVEKPNGEAARYRTRLREAEAQRDALRVLAQREVTVIGPSGHTTATAQAVLRPDGEIHYLIPALGLTLTQEAALRYAGGLANLVEDTRNIPPHTITID